MITTASRGRRALTLTVAGLTMLALAGCASGGAEPAAGDDTAACAPEDIQLVGQVRNETNPYEKAWLDGGDAFAESVGLAQTRLTYDGESPKQQDQLRQALSTGNPECMVLNILPNGDSDTTPIVKEADAAGAYLVTHWNKPADLNPADYDTWITHVTFNGVDSGQQIAEAMFEAMGGEGGIIALQGILDTSAAKDRFQGLQNALDENPGITLLDEQAADFDRTTAFNITKTLLTKHGDAITGVWAANDDMALGALQALEAAGRSGEVAVVGIDAVPEAVQAVADGAMTATVSVDGPWQGGIGLAMGYCALTGELDVADIEDDKRAFYAKQTLVTTENAAANLAPEANLDDFACDSLFDRFDGAVG